MAPSRTTVAGPDKSNSNLVLVQVQVILSVRIVRLGGPLQHVPRKQARSLFFLIFFLLFPLHGISVQRPRVGLQGPRFKRNKKREKRDRSWSLDMSCMYLDSIRKVNLRISIATSSIPACDRVEVGPVRCGPISVSDGRSLATPHYANPLSDASHDLDRISRHSE